MNQVNITKSQWGIIVPTKIGSDKKDQDKLLACTFLAGVQWKRYGTMVNKLNNMFLTGQNHYPMTVEVVMMMLLHYIGDKLQAYRSDTNEMSVNATSFAQ